MQTLTIRATLLAATFIAVAAATAGTPVRLDTPTSRPAPPASAIVVACSEAGSMADVFPGIQKQLKGIVDALPAKSKFDVVLFNAAEQKKASDEPVAADTDGKAAADKMIDAATAAGDGDAVAGATAALDLKPAQLFLLLDQVGDPAALTKAVDTADPKHKVKLVVIYLSGGDAKADKEPLVVLKKLASARNGSLKVLKKSDLK